MFYVLLLGVMIGGLSLVYLGYLVAGLFGLVDLVVMMGTWWLLGFGGRAGLGLLGYWVWDLDGGLGSG